MTAALAPRDYVDPATYDAEVQRVLRTGWLPACRVDQVARPGDRWAVTLAGCPVVVTHDATSGVRVLANVCQHRGSVIVDDGPGTGSTLVCPYHRWAYRLDGSLVGAPLVERADVADVCLPRIRHAVWNGFVLVNLTGDAEDPAEELSGLDEHIAPWRWADLVTVGSMTFQSEWNWKVMVENWIECYHHIGTHRDTVEPFQPARTTRVLPGGGAPWAAMTVDTIGGVEGEPTSWIPGLPEERSRDLSVWAAFPLLLGGSISRYAFWLHIVPFDASRHEVTWNILMHPDQIGADIEERVAHELEVLQIVHAEDMAACRRVQAGLASGALDQIRLAPLEATIADFQRWVASRLDGTSAGTT